MIFIGNDIVEISRIKKNIDNYSHLFINKIFSKEEANYCNNKKFPEIHFAGKFAAKESVFKAIRQYDNNLKVFFKDIEVLNDSNSKPFIRIQMLEFSAQKIQISISHSKSYATSVAILYKC